MRPQSKRHQIVTEMKQTSPPGSVANIVMSDVPIMSAGVTAGSAIEMLRGRSFASAGLILLTYEFDRYVGAVETVRLLSVSGDTVVADCKDVRWPVVSPSLDQEHAAELAARIGVDSLAVVDGSKPLGIVTAATLLTVMAHEHHEDMNRFVGIMAENHDAMAALEDHVLRRVARRLPWLVVGLALSSLATAAMSHFEDVLRANVTLALFIPALIYITVAVGT
jgi:magnesium transporter